MLEVVAYLAAQQVTHDLAREALPDAPVRSDVRQARHSTLIVRARQRVSLALRVIADRVEPAPGAGATSLGYHQAECA